MAKQVKLKGDEFHPQNCKTNFWMLPKPIAADTTLSPGAKLLYATLFSLASGSGAAFATQKKLSDQLGKSTRMINRYKEELEQAGLIRVLQRGRGLSNHYYMLRHPMLGNAEDGEFEPGPRRLYRDRQYNTQTIVSEEDALYIYEDRLREWYEASCRGEFVEFPKPGIKLPCAVRKELETKWRNRYIEEVIAGKAVISLPDEETQMNHDTGATELQSVSQPSAATLDYDAVFSRSSTEDLMASKLSDEPAVMTLPSGHSIQGPSSRQLYDAAMKRRKEANPPYGSQASGVPRDLLEKFMAN